MDNSELGLTIEEYQAVLDNIDDGIFIISKKGVILAVNKAVEKNGGKKVDELLGKSIEELIKENYCTEFVSSRVIASGKKETLIQRTKDNRELLVTGIPYYKQGKLQMVIACERDVTELTKTKERLSKIKTLNRKYEEELDYLRHANDIPPNIINVSKKMQQTIETVKKISKLDTTVLIQGESGTGKEVIANLIYKTGSRSDKPFIKINCGAIPENLLESEMFGYVEGAFTGAKKVGRSGYFGMANGGTIFLDEINGIPFNLQVKLLRVIQEREMMPVGSDVPIKLDIRIIAAANEDLKKMVSDGKFRKDLYYRIGVVSIDLPSLKERKEDILPLANLFLNKFNTKYEMEKSFSNNAKKVLLNYSWPGNVREIENVVESLVVISDSKIITEHDVKSYIYKETTISTSENLEITGSIEEMVNHYEAELLKKVYHHCKNTGEMAKMLKTTRSTINRKLLKYNIR